MSATRSAILAAIASLLSPDGVGNVQLAQSPPQFDSSLKLMTTAAAIQAGIQASGITLAPASQALTATVVGGTVVGNSATATTQTLPAASSIPAGKRIEFLNIGTGVMTTARNGTADTITANSATVTSIALGAGDTLTLESNGVNGWYSVGGSAALPFSPLFGNSLSSAGYQKFPNGMILQWTTIAASTGWFCTFPISFPNACLATVATNLDTGASYCTLTAATKSGTSGNRWSSSGAGVAGTTQIIAIGF